MSVSEISFESTYSEWTVVKILEDFTKNPFLSDEVYQCMYTDKHKIKSVILLKEVSLEKVVSHYLKESVLYKMITTLFYKGKIDRTSFCAEYYISLASFTRERKKLISILEQNGLDLSSRNDLNGSEYQIRQFFFLFYSSLDLSEVVREKFKARISDEHFFELLPIEKEKNDIMSLIFYISVERNHNKFYTEKTIDLDRVLAFSTPEIKKKILFLRKFMKKIFYRSLRHTDDELVFLLFFLINQDIFPICDVEGIDFLGLFSEKNGFISVVKSFSVLIRDKYFESEQNNKATISLSSLEQQVSLFLFCKCFYFSDRRCFLYTMGGTAYFSSVSYEYELQSIIKEWLDKLKTDKNEFIDKLKSLPSGGLENDLYLFVYSLISTKRDVSLPAIKVCVKNSNLYIQEIIQMKLQFFFQKRIQIVSIDEKEIDIFISDKIENYEQVEVNKVYLPTFSNKEYMKRTFNAIEEVILKKIEGYLL